MQKIYGIKKQEMSEVLALKCKGLNVRQISEETGHAEGSLGRWLRIFNQHGFDAIVSDDRDRLFSDSLSKVVKIIDSPFFSFGELPAQTFISRLSGISPVLVSDVFKYLIDVGRIHCIGSDRYKINPSYIPPEKKKELSRTIEGALKVCRKDIYTEAENDHVITQTRYLACRA